MHGAKLRSPKDLSYPGVFALLFVVSILDICRLLQ